MRNIFLLFSIFSFSFSFAQTPKTSTAAKNIIGYFNYDSLLNILPGYKETADSVKNYKQNKNSQLIDEKVELKSKSKEYDSLKNEWTPLIRKLKLQELADIKNKIKSDSLHLNTIEGAKFEPYEIKLTEAAKKIALSKGYTAVVDSKNASDFVTWADPGISFVNMTKDICAELQIK
jgi:Skp family chaperone for outer membrane proteins